MARPKRGNYATGEAGLARYKEALRKYLAKTKKTTKPEVKKPVAKKPVAKKPATKKPAVKKTVAKKPPVKKPVAKKPATTTRPKRTANQLKIKKATTTAQKAIKKATPVVKKAAKTVAKKAGEAKKTVTKKAGQLRQAIKKGRAPAPKTPQQKAVSKAYRGTKKYAKTALKKGGKDLLKIGKGILKNPKSAIKGGLGGIATEEARKIINRRVDSVFAKRKGMSVDEYRAAKKKALKGKGIISAGKNLVNKIKGKSGGSPITKKTISKAPNRTEKQKTDLQIAKDRAKKAKGYNKEKLQREVRYQEKFGKQGRTWSNPVGAEGKGKPSTVKTEKKATPTKKYGRAPKGYIKAGTKFVPIRSAKGKQALNRQRNKERAQAAARERLRKKKQNQ